MIGNHNHKGFTLVEILIVIIIVGVLAGLAVPAYQTTVERSRRTEAIQMLSGARGAQMRFFMQNNNYASLHSALDFDVTNTAADPPGNVRHWTYTNPVVGGAGGTSATFTITARRNTVAGGNTADTVVINQAGAIT
jgi:type IV pilus assembly protein PilE